MSDGSVDAICSCEGKGTGRPRWHDRCPLHGRRWFRTSSTGKRKSEVPRMPPPPPPPPQKDRWRDWHHECQSCSWTGWSLPECNAEGHHLNPESGTCPGPIHTVPPPTREPRRV